MTETINGLLSVKPGNEPEQGETRTFVIEHRPARDGKKAWIKVKSAGADYGGVPYRILSAEPTGYTDPHGNVSFNVEVEPVNGVPTPDPDWPEAGRDLGGPPHGYRPFDDRQAHIERQHSQEMALRFFAIGKVCPTTKQLRDMISWFQRDISHSPDDQTK